MNMANARANHDFDSFEENAVELGKLEAESASARKEANTLVSAAEEGASKVADANAEFELANAKKKALKKEEKVLVTNKKGK